jgi:VWFA-related protein
MIRLPLRMSLIGAVILTAAAPPPQQPFRAAVMGVNVTVSVQDGRRGVSGLRAEDFTLTDNGVPQRITAVSVETVPIDLSLVLDTSSSITAPMLTRLRSEVNAVTAFLQPADRVSLTTFSSTVREIVSLHTQHEPVTSLPLAPTGATAFYHAVVAALLTRATPGRPHVVLILSDGDDNVSFLDGGDLADLASRTEVVLYVVLRGAINARGSRVGWLASRGPGSLEPLASAAAATGGEVRHEKLDAPVAALFKRVIDDFKASYVLSYMPRGVEAAGWHNLAVTVKETRYAVRARRGYYGG